MLVHKITEENAEALKIQTGQGHQNRKIKPGELRKTKKRTYKKTILFGHWMFKSSSEARKSSKANSQNQR